MRKQTMLNKKLSLNKNTIAHLDTLEMGAANGGDLTIPGGDWSLGGELSCGNEYTCGDKNGPCRGMWEWSVVMGCDG